MSDSTLRELDRILESRDATAAVDLLIEHFTATGELRALFDAKLMKARLQLGLPPTPRESSETYGELRDAYDSAAVQAAREVGQIALDRGDIPGAWPYFRALGERKPVSEAIEAIDPSSASDRVIEIAFQEGINPGKGLEFILVQHGICRAITCFGMFPVGEGRADCTSLLVRHLHSEVRERISATIETQEGSRPADTQLPRLMEGREWLFGEYDTYVDTSHLNSVLPYSHEIADSAVLELLAELCEYGKRLSSMFQSRGQPPFEQPFVDYSHYIQARLRRDVDTHLEHFRAKLREAAEEADSIPAAELLVSLLAELGRYEEAIGISLQHLSDVQNEISCPALNRLYTLAADYDGMRDYARGQGDLLNYVTGAILSGSS